jgi:hypothetical protein
LQLSRDPEQPSRGRDTSTAKNCSSPREAVRGSQLAIRDLKTARARLCPRGRSAANAAWLLLATLAHNLIRPGWPKFTPSTVTKSHTVFKGQGRSKIFNRSRKSMIV